jgi:hypothetical protein
MKSGERRRNAANDVRGGRGLVVGNIGKEAPEIDVLPVEQPVPAEHESRSAEPEPMPAEPAPVPEPEPEPVPA